MFVKLTNFYIRLKYELDLAGQCHLHPDLGTMPPDKQLDEWFTIAKLDQRQTSNQVGKSTKATQLGEAFKVPSRISRQIPAAGPNSYHKSFFMVKTFWIDLSANFLASVNLLGHFPLANVHSGDFC